MGVPDQAVVPETFQHATCVVESTLESLATLCNIQFTQAAQPLPEVPPSDSLLAIIALMGDLDWSLGLALPRETAVAVVAKFAGFDVPFDSADMGDAMGELANIVGGTTKAKLDAKGVRVDISLPTVLRGQNVQLVQSLHSPSLCQSFMSPLGGLQVAIVAGKHLVAVRQPGA
jgi:chemotaxis protein CheX